MDPSDAPSQMCGYTFKAGDLVWSCRQCQFDDTCVMCHDCFVNSHVQKNDTDESGSGGSAPGSASTTPTTTPTTPFLPTSEHDVFFNLIPRDLPPGQGGCCDCGDEEALDGKHFCPRHSVERENDKPAPNPESILPPSLRHGGRRIIQSVVQCLVEMERFDHLRRKTRESFPEGEDFHTPWERFPHVPSTNLANIQPDSILNTPTPIFVDHHNPSNTLPLEVKGWCWERIVTWLESMAEMLPTLRILLSRCLGEEMYDMPPELCAEKKDEEAEDKDEDEDKEETMIRNKNKISILKMILFNTKTMKSSRWDTMKVTKIQHSLLMKCLALFEFKDTFSVAYVESYPEVYRRLLDRKCGDNSAIFTFSVQFMNRKTHVVPLVDDRGYYELMLTSLLKCLLESTLDHTDATGHVVRSDLMERTLDGRVWSQHGGPKMNGFNRTMDRKIHRLPLTDMRYALNNEGMKRRFVETLQQWNTFSNFEEESRRCDQKFTKGMQREKSGLLSASFSEEQFSGRWYKTFGTMQAFQLWIEILLRSNGLHRQRRKRGDAIAHTNQAWVNAFDWSISLNRTGQELFRYLACSELGHPEILHEKCTNIMSILFISSSGNVRKNRVHVQVRPIIDRGLDHDSFLPSGPRSLASSSEQQQLDPSLVEVFHRCGIEGTRTLWVHPETVSFSKKCIFQTYFPPLLLISFETCCTVDIFFFLLLLILSYFFVQIIFSWHRSIDRRSVA